MCCFLTASLAESTTVIFDNDRQLEIAIWPTSLLLIRDSFSRSLCFAVKLYVSQQIVWRSK